ncbi:MAG: ATP-dependent DNA helicase RecG, partial [Gammaproteobacteria bacterium]|nr:ATP-dependent DNA helicase RecG [Gammaproteobacteria bacterium]
MLNHKEQDLSEISLQHLKGVATKQSERLAKLGINNIQDLLLHLPLRYEDRTRLVSLDSLQPGMQCVVEGVIDSTNIIPGRRRMLLCRMRDDSGSIDLRFFNFYPNQVKQLTGGTKVRCFGEIRRGRQGLEMIHPEYSVIYENTAVLNQNTLTPIYPTTEGLGQASLRRLVTQALAMLNSSNLRELIERHLLTAMNLPAMPLIDALHFIHNPDADADQLLLEQGHHPCQQRLVLEELLAHQLAMQKLRHENAKHKAFRLTANPDLLKPFLHALTFS